MPETQEGQLPLAKRSHPVLLRVPLHLHERFQAEARRRVLADATTILQLARERLDQLDGEGDHE
jgi:hypothetical protein